MTTITTKLIATWMQRAKTKRDLQRVQCMSLRRFQQMRSQDIAVVVGMSPVTVRRVWVAYAKDGEETLFDEKRGGRHNAHMEMEEETIFLAPFLKQARAGGLLNVKPVHRALQKKVGQTIPLSTTYAMLHRQGWRKIAPRAHHPKGDIVAQEKFKTSFPPDRPAGGSGGEYQRTQATRSVRG